MTAAVASPPLMSIVCAAKDNAEGVARLLGRFEATGTLSKEIELVVIDGASQDLTASHLRSAAQRLADRLVSVSEPDTGIYSALNKATRLARGSYVYVIGSDDELLIDDLPEILDALRALETPTAVILDFEQELGEGRSQLRYRVSQESYARHAASCPPIHHQGFLMPLAAFRGGFDQRYSLHADYKAMSLCLREFPLIYLPRVLCRFRLGGASSLPAQVFRSIGEQVAIRRELAIPQPALSYAVPLIKAVVIATGLTTVAGRLLVAVRKWSAKPPSKPDSKA